MPTLPLKWEGCGKLCRVERGLMVFQTSTTPESTWRFQALTYSQYSSQNTGFGSKESGQCVEERSGSYESRGRRQGQGVELTEHLPFT